MRCLVASFIAQDGSVDTFKPPELTNGRGRLRDVKEMNEEKRTLAECSVRSLLEVTHSCKSLPFVFFNSGKPQVLLEIFQSYDVNGDQACRVMLESKLRWHWVKLGQTCT